MYKFNNRELASDKAKEVCLAFGLSIYDGYYYVGQPKDLRLIGVFESEYPIG